MEEITRGYKKFRQERRKILFIIQYMGKAAFSRRKTLFTSKLDLNLRKKLVKCYIWSMALYGAETLTLRAADQKNLESFEMW
jgi:hypothetical protein